MRILVNALYGLVKYTLLWYTLFTKVLQKEGITLNLHDTSVANKSTVGWYVDDNILSHVESEVVDKNALVII